MKLNYLKSTVITKLPLEAEQSQAITEEKKENMSNQVQENRESLDILQNESLDMNSYLEDSFFEDENEVFPSEFLKRRRSSQLTTTTKRVKRFE